MRIKKVTIIAEKISKPAYFCGLFIFMQRCYLCIPQESTFDIEIVMCVFSKLRPSLCAYKEYMIMHLLSYWICNVCVYTVIENQKASMYTSMTPNAWHYIVISCIFLLLIYPRRSDEVLVPLQWVVLRVKYSIVRSQDECSDFGSIFVLAFV